MATSARFKEMTVVAVTGLPDASGAARAVIHSQRKLPGSRALLCSPVAPAGLPPEVTHRAIAPLNYQEYSWFMLFALGHFVETGFALIVQDDGWVLGAENWCDEFLDYDYVGAPTHLARVDSPQGTDWLSRFTWCKQLGLPDRVVMPVLNGGFCLRSRRMMRALIDHPHIRVQIPPPDELVGQPPKLRWLNDALNEDVQLSTVLRPELEAAGLRFAPLDLARRFAIESAGGLHLDLDIMTVFGLHGAYRKLDSADPPGVRYTISLALASRLLGEAQIINTLRERGYHLTFLET